MHLRLSVARGTSSLDHDIVAEIGHTLGDLCDALPGAHGVVAAEIGGALVGRDAPIGLPPLLDGATLRLLGSDAVSSAVPAGGTGAPSRALLELQCVAGPDLGRTWALPPGRQVVGRGLEATIRLDDPECSRQHAVIEVTTAGVLVHDPGATNGVAVNDLSVRTPTRLRLEDRLRVGRTTLVTRALDGRRLAAVPAGDGTLTLNQAPRTHVATTPRTVTFPRPPLAATRRAVPVLAMLLPAVVAAALAIVLRSPIMLAFGLLTPLLMVGTQVGERRAARRDGAVTAGEFAAASRHAWDELNAAVADEERHRRAECPDLADRRMTARDRMISLWQNGSDDHLVVSVGRGDVPAQTRAVVEGRPNDPPPDQRIGPDGAAPPAPTCHDVPLTIDLTGDPCVGVVGDPARRVALIGSVVAQLCVGWGPSRLVVEVDPVTRDGLHWCRWLPHALVADGSLPETGQRRLRITGPSPSVGVTGGVPTRVPTGATAGATSNSAEPTRRPATIRLAHAERAHELPAECTVVVTVSTDGDVVVRGRDGGERHGRADLPAPGIIEEIARSLAPLRERPAGPRARILPEEISLGDLLAATGDLEAIDTRSMIACWQREPTGRRTLGGLRAALGVDPDGPLVLDLATQGPHALVAGTTGSGKSELLTTLVTSLAATHSPREVTFVLIDYKGGASFRDCARLPHTVGFVTDLDGHLARRALISLSAEIKHRERALRASGSSTLAEHNARAAPLPRIVIVIDEFRVLAEELPEFVAGMVQIASVGRSLGISVILATQRPAGVVTADIRANVGVRIALRVRDRADSIDVVDSPDAAELPAATPGRALLATADRTAAPFQTARVDLPPRTGRRRVRIVTPGIDGLLSVDAQPATQPATQPAEAAGEPVPASELTAVVVAATAAAAELGIPAPRTPWLPPLPTMIPVVELPRRSPDPQDPRMSARPGSGIPIGLVDDPEHQRQYPLLLDLARAGNLAICGAPRSGRTTGLRTIARQLAATHSPADLHLYAIHTGGLAELEGAPHTGVVARADDVDLGEALIALLTSELRERRARSGRSGNPGLPGSPGDPDSLDSPDSRALVVLLIDDWEVLTSRLADHRNGRPLEELHRLIGEGPAVGIVTVATGGRALSTGRAAGTFGERLLCRPADLNDLYLLGIPADIAQHLAPPGRAVRASDGLIAQLAIHTEPLDTPANRPGGPAGTPAGPIAVPAQRSARRIRQLPHSVGCAELPDNGELLVGLGGVDCAPVGFSAGADRRLLVLGPAASGRSTTLTTIAERLRRAGRRLAVVTARRSVLSESIPAFDRFDPHSPADVERFIARRVVEPDLALIVDDAQDTTASVIADALAEFERLVDSDRGLIVVATTPAALATRRCPLGQDVAVHRTGLLLPGCTSADLVHLGHSEPLGAAASSLPGRARLARPGAPLTTVQLATPSYAAARPGAGSSAGSSTGSSAGTSGEQTL